MSRLFFILSTCPQYVSRNSASRFSFTTTSLVYLLSKLPFKDVSALGFSFPSFLPCVVLVSLINSFATTSLFRVYVHSINSYKCALLSFHLFIRLHNCIFALSSPICNFIPSMLHCIGFSYLLGEKVDLNPHFSFFAHRHILWNHKVWHWCFIDGSGTFSPNRHHFLIIIFNNLLSCFVP